MHVGVGETLLKAAEPFDYFFMAECGGQGTCGKCRIRFLNAVPEPLPEEQEILTEAEIHQGIRLACRHKVTEDVWVSLPEEEDVDHADKAAALPLPSGFTIKCGIEKRAVPVCRLTTTVAERLNMRSHWSYVRGHLPAAWRKRPVKQSFLSQFADLLERECSVMTIVSIDGWLMGAEADDTTDQMYGVAVDIGTTTVACYLVNLKNGEVVGATAGANSQRRWGGDVISRLTFALTQTTGLRELKAAIRDTINHLIWETAREAGVDTHRIYRLTVVGNTAMSHLFFGWAPRVLGMAPYLPVAGSSVQFSPGTFGIELQPTCQATFLSCVAGFVGADSVAVMLATNMDRRQELSLAVDIGTNGETMVGNRDRIICGSNAAGPAFEGARISQGMRAARGAVYSVVLDRDICLGVVGDSVIRGICGSGLVDAIATLLDAGLIDASGHIPSVDELPPNTLDCLKRRIVEGDRGNSIILASSKQTHNGRPLLITQQDVREVQLAVGAIAAGRKILLKERGIEENDLERIMLAGAFGSHINSRSAMRIGLIPKAPLDRVEFIGNAAGEGARHALLSRDVMERADRISEMADFVEFARRQDFQDAFIDAMEFPSD